MLIHLIPERASPSLSYSGALVMHAPIWTALPITVPQAFSDHWCPVWPEIAQADAPVSSWPQEQLQSALDTLLISGNCGPEGLSSSCLWVIPFLVSWPDFSASLGPFGLSIKVLTLKSLPLSTVSISSKQGADYSLPVALLHVLQSVWPL